MDFTWNLQEFSSETWGWSRVMHTVWCIYLKIDLFKKSWNYRCLCVVTKVAWITHESCMCLAWKALFSACLSALCTQRNIRAFLQTLLQYILRKCSNFQTWCVNISFFHTTKPPNTRGTLRDHAGTFARVAQNLLKKLEDAHVLCMGFAAFTWRSIFSRKCLRAKLPIPLCCRKSCVDHERIWHVSRIKSTCTCSIFRVFTRITLAKEN